jgi:hypothetical protein
MPEKKNNLSIKYTKYSDITHVMGLLHEKKAMNINDELLKVVTEFKLVLSLSVKCDVGCKFSEGFGKSLGHYLVLLGV